MTIVFTTKERQLIDGVKAHALANYDKDGWDFVVECWDDEQILDYVEGCRSVSGAIRRCRQTTKLLDESRRAVRAEIF